MAYLVVNNSKSYNVTNAYNKPYMKVNGSILPLTTIGGGVIHCKVDNTTYRPLEYKSTSSSESNSWYTSAVNSNGMYDTTALTRASTSGTSYLTQQVEGQGYIKYYLSSSSSNSNVVSTIHTSTSGETHGSGGLDYTVYNTPLVDNKPATKTNNNIKSNQINKTYK